jgi:hypothetical protein
MAKIKSMSKRAKKAYAITQLRTTGISDNRVSGKHHEGNYPLSRFPSREANRKLDNLGGIITHTGGRKQIAKPQRYDTYGKAIHPAGVAHDYEFKHRLTKEPLENIKAPDRIERTTCTFCRDKYKDSEQEINKHNIIIPSLVNAKLDDETKAYLKAKKMKNPKVLKYPKEPAKNAGLFFCPKCAKREHLVDEIIEREEHYIPDENNPGLYIPDEKPKLKRANKPLLLIYDKFDDPDYKGPYPAAIMDYDPKRTGPKQVYHKTDLKPTKHEIEEAMAKEKELLNKEPTELTSTIKKKHEQELQVFYSAHPNNKEAKEELDRIQLDKEQAIISPPPKIHKTGEHKHVSDEEGYVFNPEDFKTKSTHTKSKPYKKLGSPETEEIEEHEEHKDKEPSKPKPLTEKEKADITLELAEKEEDKEQK